MAASESAESKFTVISAFVSDEEDARAVKAAAEAASKSGLNPKMNANTIRVRPQPGITLYNGADQTPISISDRKTGEVVDFGKKVAERQFEGVEMYLTIDSTNQVVWILVHVLSTGAFLQNGYLVEHHQDAFQMFMSGTEAEVRSILMTDPPPPS